MSLTINNNQAALIALQNLNATEASLQTTQNDVSTGLAVNNAKDNAAIWSIAQGQRADISALDAVTQSLNRATSIADVASTAGQSVSDLLTQLKAKVVAAVDSSLNTSSRTSLNNDFKSILHQISDVVSNASFDGANILNGSLPNGLQFLANAGGTSTLTLSSENLTIGGGVITFGATASIGTATQASLLLTQINLSLTNVDSALGSLGSQSNEITAHTTFIGKLQDVLQTGVGNLVDANMATESAKLQALQVQQQLGVQALSIANQSPNTILSLFK
jgi:flagellin